MQGRMNRGCRRRSPSPQGTTRPNPRDESHLSRSLKVLCSFPSLVHQRPSVALIGSTLGGADHGRRPAWPAVARPMTRSPASHLFFPPASRYGRYRRYINDSHIVSNVAIYLPTYRQTTWGRCNCPPAWIWEEGGREADRRFLRLSSSGNPSSGTSTKSTDSNPLPRQSVRLVVRLYLHHHRRRAPSPGH